MSRGYRTLSTTQIEAFLEHGFIVLKDCFPRELAEEWTAFAYKRLGYDPGDATTWEEPRLHLPAMNRVSIREIAPKAFDAICDLVGGEDRLANPDPGWGDGFVINSFEADSPWQPPSPAVQGWHKDGDFFRHFLDSPEQGLLTIVIWSDIHARSGGTFIAGDSVQHVAKRLYEHPEGLLSGDFTGLIEKSQEFTELTGSAGDFVLLHPFILHSASRNPSGRARFITNPPVSLNQPMNFDRDDPDDFSPVELAVLRGLGRERLDFQITAPRERLVADRVKRQQEMLDEQKVRLASLGPTLDDS